MYNVYLNQLKDKKFLTAHKEVSVYDIIIIGAGPAGISAALYACRANMKVAVIYSGESQLEKAHKVDNYYGFPEGISGPDLYGNGILQARNLGVEIFSEEVVHLEMATFPPKVSYRVKTSSNEFTSPAVIIAAGNKKLRPAIEGIVDFEGKGVSYCAVCDGFFYRNKKVSVIGNGSFAFEEASYLSHVAQSVVILTDGKPDDEIKKLLPAGETNILCDARKIQKITGEQKVQSVEFADGQQLETDGIFVALGSAGAANFAKVLGLNMKGDSIIINEKCETNAPGIYCAGNASGGLLQVSKAVYEGAVAGLSAVEYVRKTSSQ